MTTTLILWRASISKISLRFSFNRNVATETGVIVRISELNSFWASSSTRRRIESANERVPRMVPWPRQRGQVLDVVSPKDGRSRCRDISSSPKREIRPTCTRALSISRESRIQFSTSR